MLRGVSQDGLGLIKLSGNPIADNGVFCLLIVAFSLLVWPLQLGRYSILRVVFQGSDQSHGGAYSFINGPSQPAFTRYSTYTYELRSRFPPPSNSRYAMLGSLSSLLLFSAEPHYLPRYVSLMTKTARQKVAHAKRWQDDD